jgi:hypothetical protein
METLNFSVFSIIFFSLLIHGQKLKMSGRLSSCPLSLEEVYEIAIRGSDLGRSLHQFSSVKDQNALILPSCQHINLLLVCSSEKWDIQGELMSVRMEKRVLD